MWRKKNEARRVIETEDLGEVDESHDISLFIEEEERTL
jgi:hypothetical protein